MQSLGALENAASGLLEMETDTLLEAILSLWDEAAAEVTALADLYFVEMSPQALFEAPPLCYCSVETRAWLAPHLHERWVDVVGAETAFNEFRLSAEGAASAMTQLRHYCDFAGTDPGTQLVQHVHSCKIAVGLLTLRLSSLPIFTFNLH
jgi:hypothetical protein